MYKQKVKQQVNKQYGEKNAHKRGNEQRQTK